MLEDDFDSMSTPEVLLLLIGACILSMIIAWIFIEYWTVWELSEILYFISPVLVTITFIVLFFILDRTLLRGKRDTLALTMAIIIVLVGVLMRLDFYYRIINW